MNLKSDMVDGTKCTNTITLDGRSSKVIGPSVLN